MFIGHIQVNSSNLVPAAVSNQPLRVTNLAWDFLKPVINWGDIVVDATAGTGQDTLFLTQCVGETGHVFAFDIQETALQQTQAVIEKNGFAGNITLIHKSHDLILSVLKQQGIQDQTVSAIMFNLGYFPGGDHAIITKVETTIMALDGALALLAAGGMITICLYPGHSGGLEESEAVINWCEKLETPFISHHFRTLNRKSPPTLVMIQRTR